MSNLLYKYLDINGAIMMLYYSNLMYANSEMFNDPFDCDSGLIDFSNISPEACKGWPPKMVEELRTNRHENYRKDLWICCLSKVYDSLLMWSYYNKHQGVCIGLNMGKVAQYIGVEYGFMVSPGAKEVEYKDIIEKPVCGGLHDDYFTYQLLTKAKAWEHEQEMRLFIYKPNPTYMRRLPFQKDKTELNANEARVFVKLGPECFESLHLGVNIDAKDKEKIVKLAKKINPDIKIFQMEKDLQKFKLVEKQLSF